MSRQVQRLLQKLKKPVDEADFLNEDVFRLMQSDPRGALTVLEAAEEAKLDLAAILELRVECYVELGEAQHARTNFDRYLEAAKAAGRFYNPPFRALANFFDEVKKKAWAAEVREVEAMTETYFLERSFGADKAELKDILADIAQTIRGNSEEEDLKGWMSTGLSEVEARRRTAANPSTPAQGDDLARLCVMQACCFERLGKKADATKAWKRAAKANPKLTNFWKGHSLLTK